VGFAIVRGGKDRNKGTTVGKRKGSLNEKQIAKKGRKRKRLTAKRPFVLDEKKGGEGGGGVVVEAIRYHGKCMREGINRASHRSKFGS